MTIASIEASHKAVSRSEILIFSTKTLLLFERLLYIYYLVGLKKNQVKI